LERIRIESSTIEREELSCLRLKLVERGARDSFALFDGQGLAVLQIRHVGFRACIVLEDRLYIVYDNITRQKLDINNSILLICSPYLNHFVHRSGQQAHLACHAPQTLPSALGAALH
jgi:hypothetical protein